MGQGQVERRARVPKFAVRVGLLVAILGSASAPGAEFDDDPGAAWQADQKAAIEAMANGDLAEAEARLKQAYEAARPLDNGDLRKITTVGTLAWLRVLQGRPADAEVLARWAVKTREVVQGSEHLDLAYDLNSLATACFNQGRPDEADPLYRRASRSGKTRSDPIIPVWPTCSTTWPTWSAARGNRLTRSRCIDER